MEKSKDYENESWYARPLIYFFTLMGLSWIVWGLPHFKVIGWFVLAMCIITLIGIKKNEKKEVEE